MLDQPTTEPVKPRAIYAALNSRPVTDEAQALVDAVVAQVLAHEHRTGKRKRHGSNADINRRLTAAFLADLLRALGSRKADGWMFRSMMTESFSGSGDASHRRFTGLIEAMEGAGLLDVRRARAWGGSRFPVAREDGTDEDHEHDDGSEEERSATKFKATTMLCDLFTAHGLEPSEVRVHFLQALPENPIVLRGASTSTKGRKVKGPKLDAMKMPALAHLRDGLAVHGDALRRLNTFLDGFTFAGGVHRGYRRVFNLADALGFAFDKGGRLYSQGEDAYQTMSKRKRRRMLINGEKVVEMDIRASFLSVLHGLNGLPFDARQDPYEVDTLPAMMVGEHDMRRWAVKAWTVATLGHSQHFTKWPHICPVVCRQANTRPFTLTIIEAFGAEPIALFMDILVSQAWSAQHNFFRSSAVSLLCSGPSSLNMASCASFRRFADLVYRAAIPPPRHPKIASSCASVAPLSAARVAGSERQLGHRCSTFRSRRESDSLGPSAGVAGCRRLRCK